MFRYLSDHRQLHMVLTQFEFTTFEHVINIKHQSIDLARRKKRGSC